MILEQSLVNIIMLIQFWQRHIGNHSPVFFVSSIHFSEPAGVLMAYLVFQVAHEKTGKTRAHFGPIGDTTNLIEEFSVELKGIES